MDRRFKKREVYLMVITKQRKVGGSMVFTVPKEFADDCNAKEPQHYQVTQREDGAIVYEPVQVVPAR
jgi:antitoxin component of MazEF toxin-antitoxin module